VKQLQEVEKVRTKQTQKIEEMELYMKEVIAQQNEQLRTIEDLPMAITIRNIANEIMGEKIVQNQETTGIKEEEIRRRAEKEDK
jgi:hypothetical protein